MKVHADELQLARAYNEVRAFESLNPEQIRLILNRGRELHRWYQSHPGTHAVIGLAVIVFILSADWVAIIWLSAVLQTSSPRSIGVMVFVALAAAVIHCWLLYSLSVLSLHEAAAHEIVFPGKSLLSRLGHFLSRNMCRLSAGEPDYYAACHMAHHARFGTEQDSEFLNFVLPGRFWRSLLPFAGFLSFNDFVIHRPPEYTRGRLISAIVAALYNGAYIYVVYRRFGLLFAVVFLLLLPHLGFYLDRLRQFTEHNLMPMDNLDGARSFGIGLWGLSIGGGPWGQPCHLAHHLVPSIPWYQQILLHRYMASLFTKRQREQFLLKPLVGYPLLLWRVVRDAGTFSRQHRAV